MASESSMNGGSPTDDGSPTPAQKLQEKHDADAAHRATIEDVIDEEDLAHPPPSMHIASADAPTPPALSNSEPVSEKAAGKQIAREEPELAAPSGKSNFQPVLDTTSEEVFPALGAGSKAKAPAPAAMAWGASKPVSMKQPSSNGVKGRGPISSSTSSSRASTPAPGILTPASANASIRPRSHGTPQNLALPGKHSEKIEFAPSELLSKDRLKKPIKDILQGINKRSKATVTMRPGPNNGLVFEGVGPLEATRQALKDVAKEIGSKVKSALYRNWKNDLELYSKPPQ